MMSATTISLTYNKRELHTKMNICYMYVESDLKNIRPALSKILHVSDIINITSSNFNSLIGKIDKLRIFYVKLLKMTEI